ncbi:MAG: hypothetical protein U0Q16_20005 [Bryobacteraceae bacterium]
MIDRRSFVKASFGLTAAAWLKAQIVDGLTFRVSGNSVVLSLTVTDRRGRHILGLKPGDLRVSEDGIQRRLSIISESGKPPLLIHDDGTGGGLGLRELESIRGEQENSYTIAYRPDLSDRGEEFHS